MAFDLNKDGKTDFSDLLAWFTTETFGMKRWMIILIAGGGWLFFLAPKRMRRKYLGF